MSVEKRLSMGWSLWKRDHELVVPDMGRSWLKAGSLGSGLTNRKRIHL